MSNTAIKPIIYSANWCAFCHAVKQYLDKLGVAYEVRDIEHDQAFAQESVQKSGQMGIPVIDIDGEIIVGFDRQKIDRALKDKHLV
ncbi:MAG TPA: glutaredoxin domain-containing protein [Candidatus Saccharimonadales bacterium]|nr:glutaredoxin domain-containing protein [Candidatus Saccharimonadales bacterium]